MTIRALLGLVLLLTACDNDPVTDDDSAAPSGDDDTTLSDDDDTTPTDDDDSASGADDDDDSAATEPPLAALTVNCTNVEQDVYVRPVGLPPWDETVLGDVVRCAHREDLDVMAVADFLDAAGVDGIDPWSGAHTYTLAYRTTRWEGEEGIGTARLYLPDTLVTGGPRPVIVVGRGPYGVDDRCAPSRAEIGGIDALALTWVGRGFAVIAPDLAGLGNEGNPGYLSTADAAHSALDAARAVIGAVTPGSVSEDTLVVGLDEFGAAALGSQALATDYLGRSLLGAVALAPDWRTGTDDLVAAFTQPGSTYFTGVAGTRLSLRMLTDGGNFNGPYGETSYFHPYVAEVIATHLWTECYSELLGTVQFEAIYYSELFEETFVDTGAQCLTGGAACGPPGQGFIERVEWDQVPMDPAGGPILVVQGLLDDVISPESTACVVEALEADGAQVQACTDASVGHEDVTPATLPFIFEWAQALIAGEPLPECSDSELPVCL